MVPFTVHQAVLCEDVRLEVTRKIFIIGAYGGKAINLLSVPGSVTLASYLEISSDAAGVFAVAVRIAQDDKTTGAEGSTVFQVGTAKVSFGVGIGPLTVHIPSSGTFQLQWRIADSADPWETIFDFRVNHDPDITRKLGIIPPVPTA